MSDSVLGALVGDWKASASFPTLGDVRGEWSFAWDLHDTALVQRTAMEHEAAPDTIAVITPDGDGFLQHYFDSRGVVRLYRMSFDGRAWTLQRSTADFSALPFHQRYTGVLAGDEIQGRWERSDDGENWELDFELVLTRS